MSNAYNRVLKMTACLLLATLLFQVASQQAIAQTNDTPTNIIEVDRAIKTPLRVTVAPINQPITYQNQFDLMVTISNVGDIDLADVQLILPNHYDLAYESSDLSLPTLKAGDSENLIIPTRLVGFGQSNLQLKVGVSSPNVETFYWPFTLPVVGDIEAKDVGLTAVSPLNIQILEKHPQGNLLTFSVSEIKEATAITFDLPDLKSENKAIILSHVETGQTQSYQQTENSLQVTVDKDGIYTLSIEANTPEPWQFTFNPPGASAFNGSAQYGYNFALPPGKGGLTPALSLSYSSRTIDNLDKPVMSRGFGAGWSMPQAEIVNANAVQMGTTDFFNHNFTLSLNGASYPLIREGGANQYDRYGKYVAIGDPKLHIEYKKEAIPNAIPNESGEYWLVKTSDGTEYRFGYTEQAEQMVEVGTGPANNPNRNQNQPRNQELAPSSWKLDQVTSLHGNQIKYFYQEACFVADSGTGCHVEPETSLVPEADVAVSEIQYSFVGTTPHTKILFDYELQNGNSLHHRNIYKTIGRFRPQHIRVQQFNGSGYQQIKRYTMQYAGVEQDAPNIANPFSWWVTSITQYGSDNTTALPTTTFHYEDISGTHSCDSVTGNCVPYLKRVENGYNAVTKLFYEQLNQENYYLVTEIRTWDGVLQRYGTGDIPTSITEYTYDEATACYDVATHPCGGHGSGYPAGESGTLVGFQKVTIEAKEGNDTTILSTSEQQFNISNYWLKGKTEKTIVYEPGTTTKRQETIQIWDVPTGSTITLLQETQSFSYDGSETMGTKQDFYYQTNRQGNQQWGLTTQTDYIAWDHTTNDWSNTVEKRTVTEYLVNPPSDTTTYRIVPWVSGVYDTNWTPLQTTISFYDGNTNYPATQTVTNGQLTLQRVLLANDPFETIVGLSPKTAYKTADTTYQYDTVGNPTHITTYNDYGEIGYDNLTLTWDYSMNAGSGSTAYTNVTTYQNGWLVTSQTNTLGHEVKFVYDDARFVGQPTSILSEIEDGTFTSMSYEYDTFGRLIKIYDDEESETEPLTVYTYNDTTLLSHTNPLSIKQQTRPDFSNAYEMATTTYHDGMGRVLQQVEHDVEVDGLTGYWNIKTTTEYDALGRTICTTEAIENTHANFTDLGCSTQNTYATTQQTYDEMGRAFESIAFDGTVSRNYYGMYQGSSWHFVVDANNHRTQYEYDVWGQLQTVKEMTGTCTPYSMPWATHYACNGSPDSWDVYSTAQYSYDKSGNLLQVDREDNSGTTLSSTTMTYDAFGRKLTMVDPDMGSWFYDYNVSGNLIWQKDANEQELCFTYDALGRVLQKGTTSNNCATIDTTLATYTYDSQTNGLGQLATASWGADPSNNKESFVYDDRGRMVAHTRVIDGAEYTLKTEAFDALGRPLTLSYPDGEVVALTYDRNGEETLTAGADILVDEVEFNGRGQLTHIGRPAPLFSTHFTYGGANDNFSLQTIQHGGVADMKPDFSYVYDNVGNITQWQTSFQGNTETQTFTYDTLNRLLTASADNNLDASYNHTYTYDELGNIIKILKDAPESDQYYFYEPPSDPNNPNQVDPTYVNVHPDGELPNHEQPNAVKRVTGGWLHYDNNGNMVRRSQDGVVYYQTFDVENRLTTVTDNATEDVTQFFYDPSGQRTMTIEKDGTVLHTPFPNFEAQAYAPPTSCTEPLNFNYHALTSYGGLQDYDDTVTIEDDGATLHIAGNSWKKLFFEYEITPHTIIEFEFQSDNEGEIHGLGVDDDPATFHPQRVINIYGSQSTILDPDYDYSSSAPNWKSYQIPIGQHVTGAMSYITIANDHDVVNPTGEARYKNVRICEQVNFTGLTIGSYGGSEDVSSTITVEDNGATLSLEGNTWKAVSHPYTITHNTILEFEFQSDNEGELQGIGFEDTLATFNPERLFQIHGTETAQPITDFNDYASPNSKQYRIPVGQYYTGVMSHLVFMMDHDAETKTIADSAFSNIRVYEQPTQFTRSHYSIAGQLIAQRQTDVASSDDFNDGLGDWSSTSSWAINSDGQLESPDSASWVHTSKEVEQQGLTHYTWEMQVEAGASNDTAGGLSIFGQTNSSGNLGDSYYFYQRAGSLYIYRFTNGTATNLQTAPAPRDRGKTYTYRASYDPATGHIQVWRDGVKLVDVTDPNPIQTGHYIATRARYGPIAFDNIKVMQEGGLAYMVTDHLGSVRSLVDETNTYIADSLTHYVPFGDYRGAEPSTNPDLINKGYTGHKHNDDIGLVYMNARYYVPEIGRFASADTIVPDPAMPQSYNRYSYVENHPINYNDPSGHCKNGRGQGAGTCQVVSSDYTPVKSENWLAIYSDWYNSGGIYSGCFKCHAAKDTPFTRLTNEQLYETHSNARELEWQIHENLARTVEPIDWAWMAADCNSNGCSPDAVAFAMLPVVPGGLYDETHQLFQALDGETITLYRAVGVDEYDDIVRFGDYGLSPNGNGKYFSLTEQGVQNFANPNNPINTENLIITQVQVPKAFVQENGYLFFDPGTYGAQHAVYFNEDQSMALYEVMSYIEVIGVSKK